MGLNKPREAVLQSEGDPRSQALSRHDAALCHAPSCCAPSNSTGPAHSMHLPDPPASLFCRPAVFNCWGASHPLRRV